MPEQSGKSLIVHSDTSGLLAKVNNILAEHSVNVEGRMRSTRGEYGYLITDISEALSCEALDR